MTPVRTQVTIHAIRRARECYGIELEEIDLARHALAIWAGMSTPLGRGGGNRELHRLEYGERIFLIVWCPHARHIVTYLQTLDQWRGGYFGGARDHPRASAKVIEIHRSWVQHRARENAAAHSARRQPHRP
jgi:hypothetical protein